MKLSAHVYPFTSFLHRLLLGQTFLDYTYVIQQLHHYFVRSLLFLLPAIHRRAASFCLPRQAR